MDDQKRARFRETTLASIAAKARAVSGECNEPKQPITTPALNPLDLMPQLRQHGLRALSLFTGCGGLDLGFDRAGFKHIASFDVLPETKTVLAQARPDWTVHAGQAGDVTQIDWREYRGRIDVLHGGPPCQPFSVAGNRRGSEDVRDMVPEFVRAVKQSLPNMFVMENVSGLVSAKFSDYLEATLYGPLASLYDVVSFELSAHQFGVPQRRRRVFFIGTRSSERRPRFQPPEASHSWGAQPSLMQTMGLRKALGLPDIGVDGLAPTLRSGWTGPRHTTSVVNSASAMKSWEKLEVWPNGVAATPEAARAFVAKNGHFRLSIRDCMVLQGFPANWPIEPPVYKALGLLGNSVAPPMAYAVAKRVAEHLTA